MAESAREIGFDEKELENLKTVVFWTVQFYYYAQLPCTHRICAEYMFDSIIFGGIKAYCDLTQSYGHFDDATKSRIEWSSISVPSLKGQLTSMFREFDGEPSVEKKCRLLLDLFKLQIVFAGVSYGEGTA